MLGAEAWAEPLAIVRVTTNVPGVRPLKMTVLVSSESPMVTVVWAGRVLEEMVRLGAWPFALAPLNVRVVELKVLVVLPKSRVVLAKSRVLEANRPPNCLVVEAPP